MTDEFEKLKNHIKALYPGQELTDAELTQMADRMIRFFAVAVHNTPKGTESTEIERNHHDTKEN